VKRRVGSTARTGADRGQSDSSAPTEAAARDGSSLCARCGLCCDGSLFGDAPLTSQELHDAPHLGLTTKTNDAGHTVLSIPCARFEHGCCGVYERRPRICRDYRCQLLPAYESGEWSLEECLDIVASLRALQRTIEELTGLAWGSFTITQVAGQLAPIDIAGQPEHHQPLLAALHRYSALAERHFNTARAIAVTVHAPPTH